MKGIFVIMLSLMIFSCNRVDKAQKKSDYVAEEYTSESIIIQPFIGFPYRLTSFIQGEVRKINPEVKIRKPIALPSQAYNKDTGRYRADSLISYLQSKGYGEGVVIGLTNENLSFPKSRYKEREIMGLADTPGRFCVVSTFLLNKKRLKSQLYKLALHELAHTRGARHCRRSSTCYMSNANGANPWDAEHDFCNYCKNFLIRKGWNFLQK